MQLNFKHRPINGAKPAIILVSNHFLYYPTPSSLNYNWSFGSLAGLFFALTGVAYYCLLKLRCALYAVHFSIFAKGAIFNALWLSLRMFAVCLFFLAVTLTIWNFFKLLSYLWSQVRFNQAPWRGYGTCVLMGNVLGGASQSNVAPAVAKAIPAVGKSIFAKSTPLLHNPFFAKGVSQASNLLVAKTAPLASRPLATPHVSKVNYMQDVAFFHTQRVLMADGKTWHLIPQTIRSLPPGVQWELGLLGAGVVITVFVAYTNRESLADQKAYFAICKDRDGKLTVEKISYYKSGTEVQDLRAEILQLEKAKLSNPSGATPPGGSGKADASSCYGARPPSLEGMQDIIDLDARCRDMFPAASLFVVCFLLVGVLFFTYRSARAFSYLTTTSPQLNFVIVLLSLLPAYAFAQIAFCMYVSRNYSRFTEQSPQLFPPERKELVVILAGCWVWVVLICSSTPLFV